MLLLDSRWVRTWNTPLFTTPQVPQKPEPLPPAPIRGKYTLNG